MSTKLYLLATLAALMCQLALSANIPKTSKSSRGLFAANLFSEIAKTNTGENVIISPISIQTSLAVTYLGAGGETATQLEKGLYLPSSNKKQVGESFADLLKTKSGEAEVIIANRIYLNSDVSLRPSFSDLAKEYFNSEAQTLDFGKTQEAIDTINSWVEKKTNNKITNLLQPGSVDGKTSSVIVNAIYFKGLWEKPFSKAMTYKKPFFISNTESVEVDTLYEEDDFLYAELPELDAKAVKLAYKDSDISLIVILPNKRDGLADLESKLSTVAINDLSSKFTLEDVNLHLPKFKIEFSIKLNDALNALGISNIFGDQADLSGIIKSGPALKVSEVQHKAFIDVNEAGSEAAAATFVKIVPLSLNLQMKHFRADHPFVFAIASPQTVYFVGHVAKF